MSFEKGRRVLRRRLEAGALAAVTLWAVSVTAGSESAASAASALRRAASLSALRWELGVRDGNLSPAAAAVLRQSPVLYAARESVAERWEEPEQAVNDVPDEEETSEETAQEPAPEAGTEREAAEGGEDNGVLARTLAPTSPDGYTVCGRVYISNSTQYALSAEELREPFPAELTAETPQILILHTHGSEAYTPAPGTEVVWSGDHRTTDSRWSVVKVGDEIANVFSEAGISVLHDRTLYDYPSYSGAYDRSLAAIRSYLAQYPSIRFILDVHRDAIEDANGNQYKVVSEIEGQGTAAQLELVMGSDGSGLEHPAWRENLKLAVAIQEQVLSEYPTLMRPVALRNSRYNQHATTGSLLVEVGAAGNSPEEARLAARLFAEQMVEVLRDRSK